MATGSFKECGLVVSGPDHKPVTGVCHMTFISSCPLSFQVMHIMPLSECLQ